MPEITLKFKFPETNSYSVSVGEMEKIIDSVHPAVSFSVDNGPCEILIEQFSEPTPDGGFWKILNIISLPLKGLFNMIFSYTDVEWEEKIRAYKLKSRITIDVLDDCEYEFSLIDSEFLWRTESFSSPVVMCDENVDIHTESIENPDSIDQCYQKFIQKMYSEFSFVLLFFGILLYNYKRDGNKATMIICGIVIVGLFIFAIFLNVFNEKKRKKLHQIFNSRK